MTRLAIRDKLCIAIYFAILLLVVTGMQAERAVAQQQAVIYAGEALLRPGEPPAKNVAVSIADRRIQAVRVGVPLPGDEAASPVIDLSCCVLLPGLIDVQTHLTTQRDMPPSSERMVSWSDADVVLRAMVHAERTLLAGFTTVRNMGSHGDAMFALRDAIAAGDVDGPRMQVAGEIIRPTGGDLRPPFRPEVEELFSVASVCDGADDCMRAVRAQAARGADTIKVMVMPHLRPGAKSQMTPEELGAIAGTAHALNRMVTASAFGAHTISQPLRAGFDAVVHGTFLDETGVRLLLEKEAFYIPTLAAARTVKDIAEDPEARVSEAWRRENLAIYHGMVESFRMALAAGVPIAFGTDAGWRPHGRNAEQLLIMRDQGMSPAAALEAATVNAAKAIGWDDRIGSIEAGKFADLIAVGESPLARLEAIMTPVFVMKGGEVYARPEE